MPPLFEYSVSVSYLNKNEEVTFYLNTTGPGIRDYKLKNAEYKLDKVTIWNQYECRNLDEIDSLVINGNKIETPKINDAEFPKIYMYTENTWKDMTEFIENNEVNSIP